MRIRMARCAGAIVGCIVMPQGLVWIMAGEGRQRDRALAETRAFVQVQRLVAYVPRDIPIDLGIACGRRTMTLPAGLIQCRGRELARIGDAGMVGSRSVAGFAMDTRFGRPDCGTGG